MSRQPLAGARGAAVVAVLLLGVGLATSRADVAVLGLPLLAVALLGVRRADGDGELVVRLLPAEGGGPLAAEVAVRASEVLDLVVLALSASGEPDRFVVVTPSRAVALRIVLPRPHSGPQDVLRAQARLVSSGSVLQVGPATATATIAAVAQPLRDLPLPRLLSLRPGGHHAPRPGDGLDFRDLHPFTPGDRLRRIDWRATARQPAESDLIVRRTDTSAEAVAVLLLDSRVDVGAVVAEWYPNRPFRKGTSALDLARSAVLSLAGAYLDAGDRVAFHDLGRPGHGVRSGGGRRQRDRVAATVNAVVARPVRSLALPPLPPAGVVLLLSTFLDDAPVVLIDLARAGGQRVVAVDVLPPARLEGLDRRRRAAFRIVRLEREARLRRLVESGVPVVPWADDAGRDLALAAAARPRRPR